MPTPEYVFLFYRVANQAIIFISFSTVALSYGIRITIENPFLYTVVVYFRGFWAVPHRLTTKSIPSDELPVHGEGAYLPTMRERFTSKIYYNNLSPLTCLLGLLKSVFFFILRRSKVGQDKTVLTLYHLIQSVFFFVTRVSLYRLHYYGHDIILAQCCWYYACFR